jgi:hypothetical protein
LVLLVMLVLLAVTAVLAVAAITGGPSAEATAGPTATTSSPAGPTSSPASPPAPTGSGGTGSTASQTPDGRPSGTASGGPVELPPVPPDTVGARFQGGVHEERYPGPNQGFDFDKNNEVYVGDFFDGDDVDVAVTRFGITGFNGVGLAPFRVAGRPQLGSCAAIPRAEWVLDAPARQVKAGTTLCFTTTAGRYGYLTVQDAGHNNAGELTRATFIFLVWEGPRD